MATAVLREDEIVLDVEQFLKLPEIKPALEFMNGRVIQKMSPRYRHSSIQAELLAALNAFAKPRRLGVARPELRCTFGGASVVPDISYIARERLPRDADGKVVEDFRIAPDLTVEIRSTGQSIGELSGKIKLCLKHGGRLGWLVDPKLKRVHVFEAGRPSRILDETATLEGGDLLPGFSMPVRNIFAWADEI